MTIDVQHRGRTIASCQTEEAADAVRRLCAMTEERECCRFESGETMLLDDVCDKHFLVWWERYGYKHHPGYKDTRHTDRAKALLAARDLEAK